MLSGRTAAEIGFCHDDVTRLQTVYESRVQVNHNVACQFLRIEGVQVSGRDDNVSIHVVTIF